MQYLKDVARLESNAGLRTRDAVIAERFVIELSPHINLFETSQRVTQAQVVVSTHRQQTKSTRRTNKGKSQNVSMSIDVASLFKTIPLKKTKEITLVKKKISKHNKINRALYDAIKSRENKELTRKEKQTKEIKPQLINECSYLQLLTCWPDKT